MHLHLDSLNPGSIFALASIFCILIVLLYQWLKLCYIKCVEKFLTWYENCGKDANGQSSTYDRPGTLTEARSGQIPLIPNPSVGITLSTTPQHDTFKRIGILVPRLSNVVTSVPMEELIEDPPPSYDEVMGHIS